MPLGDAHDNTAPTAITGLGLVPKVDYPVGVAAIANVNIASSILGQTVNGYVLAEADHILLTAQTTGSQNGIYEVQDGSPPTRVGDFDTSAEFTADRAFVETVGNNVGRRWYFANEGAFTLDTTTPIFVEDNATAISLVS